MKCRACNSSNIFNAIDMGLMPISNELSYDKSYSEKFELIMCICRDCGLGQISKDISNTRLFTNYTFASSVNEAFVSHAKKYSDDIIDKIGITKDDWVLEIGSNDGYMLQHFNQRGISVLGIDPAINISKYAILNGIPTIQDFFGEKLAVQILEKRGYPKLIIANNVFAHVPNIIDFAKGLKVLTNENTLITIENPSIINILVDHQVDTIYHEHYSYLSCLSVNNIMNSVGLNLFNLEKIPVTGGANRYWVSKNKPIDKIINDTIQEEISFGIINFEKWKISELVIKEKIKKFSDRIDRSLKEGKNICGYAASSKATVLLNLAGIKKDSINCISDDGIDKQGKYIPGVNIPIVSYEEMINSKPDEVIVFSWNIFDYLKNRINSKNQDIKVWSWLDC